MLSPLGTRTEGVIVGLLVEVEGTPGLATSEEVVLCIIGTDVGYPGRGIPPTMLFYSNGKESLNLVQLKQDNFLCTSNF